MIDLRSDTVTQPTKEMLETILESKFGDDGRVGANGRGEDSTINELEDLAAEMTGKEAALYLNSGTMGNNSALMTYCRPGDKVLVDTQQHILKSEKGMFSDRFGQLIPVLYNYDENGCPVLNEVENELKKGNIKLLCVENSHNSRGGSVIPLEHLAEMKKLADKYNVPVHMDGARLFNAAISLGVDASEICRYVDSVMFCVSKGLGAPVGSLVCSSKEFIHNLRDSRKLLGGNMRQAGVIAAPGIYALRHNVAKLKNDHDNAALLSRSLADLKKVQVQQNVQTNIVMIDTSKTGLKADEYCEKLSKKGIGARPAQVPDHIRLVFHLGISREDTLKTIEIIRELDGEL